MRRAHLVRIALLLSALAPLAHATWYGENVERGADIMMMDIRYPWWSESLYNAHWNFAFDAPGFSGYGGFTMGVAALPSDFAPNRDPEVQAAWRPGSVWSFWGSTAEGEPVRVIESSRYTYPRQYVGEGASGSLGGPCWPFVARSRWYTVLLRLWQPLGDSEPSASYLGRWVKDVESDEWHLYGVVRLPVRATCFTGNAGFLEDFGNGGRSVCSVHRRLGYFRKEGAWRKSDTVQIDVPPETGAMNTYWVAEAIEDGRVLALERTSNPKLLPQQLTSPPLALGQSFRFPVAEPDGPSLDAPAVEGVAALSSGRQVLVSWEIPAGAAPQLGWRVEVFADAACTGAPVALREERNPTTRQVLLDAQLVQPTVRLTVTDIFDQQAAPIVLSAQASPDPSGAVEERSAPGLLYELRVPEAERHVNVYYPECDKADFSREERHWWVSLAELEGARTLRSGVCRGLDTELRGDRTEGYGFLYRGLLRAPRTGLYLFRVAASEGYRVTIDGREALVWDGLHGPERRSFALSLAEGEHPIALEWFVDRQAPYLQLEWEGPGLARQEVPASALRRIVSGTAPAVSLRAAPDPSGTVRAEVTVEPNGHAIEGLQLFLDGMLIAEAEGAALRYEALTPAGGHALSCRVLHDGSRTLDSEALEIEVPAPELEDWDLGIAGEARAVRNLAQPEPDAFTFVGEGEFVVFRQIRGDFTLTGRIVQCLGAGGEPVNPSSWVGLTVRERPKESGWRWGGEFGVFETAGYGLRATPDFSDLGGGRMSLGTLPAGERWLRVVRQGSLWTAWTSGDGRSWTLRASHLKPLAEEVGAGVVFRALPQDARMYFRAEIRDVSLVAGLPAGWSLPEPVAAAALASVDLTGVVSAPSDPRVVVVRSATRGLLRSEDGGESWREANGALEGAANCVRSVAIHPSDPLVMLRAAGRTDAVGGFEGGLYRSADAGATWVRLPLEGDFDGWGPSALCGEVIAFSPTDPQTLLVGCETRGLLRSDDGGASWTSVLPAGERVTAVRFHPWDLTDGHALRIQAVTCADGWMPFLGRGDPSPAAASSLSRAYASWDAGASFRLQHERADLGYLSIGFPDYIASGVFYGSTLGLCTSFTDGRECYLVPPPVAVESGRPLAAVGVTRVRNETWPRTYVQALDPASGGRLSRLDYSRDGGWAWQQSPPGVPGGRIALEACDLRADAVGSDWWMLAPDGLYRSRDNLGSAVRVLE